MDSGNCEQKQSKKDTTESLDTPEKELQETQDSPSAEVQGTDERKAIWEQDVRNASPISAGSPKNSDAQTARQTPTIDTPASLRDKYTLIQEIGHGTQGRIYLAETTADHFQVAIKQLMIESVTNWKAYELFHREAEVLSSLRIRGVARFYDAIECLTDDPPCSYIVQEYIPGQSLNDMLKAGHRFSLDRVYDIILQLLGIIGKLWLHNPPVIHRDIKPSNIILKPLGGDEFMVYLIDFGAVASPKVQGGGSTVAGTYGYMPPEQLMGKPVPQSDIYSLAAVAVHLITGISPANLPVKDFHLIFEPEMQNMPPALVQTLREMLEPNVESRLCDMEELCHRFLDFSHAVYDSRLTGLVAALSDEAYFAKLKDVQYYGQDGNIELWQRLPDQTPRFEPAISDDESEESEEIKEKNSSDTPEESKPSQTSGEMALPFDFETQFKALLSEIDSQSEGYDFIKDNVENLLGNDIWHALKKENTL
ncbi:MAG: serine/threonine protein kinase, partial [Proteobacteria bacterium]|nr:serine/threonine protein kinase [Pseudomonadota bacterium]